MGVERAPAAGAERVAPSAARAPAALYVLWLLGAAAVALTVVTPFVFRARGDNAFMALAIATGLVAIAATYAAERAPARGALWAIGGVALLLRAYLLFTEPLLSTDIYRYVWDGVVQGAGVNPYRYIPADPALAHLRDSAVYPNINRADYAVTAYPPVAQVFFFLSTRLGASVLAMKLAFLACEAAIVAAIIALLRRTGRPVVRVVAYLWHPLPLWEIANNGHIDALMTALTMLGLWLAVTDRPLWAAAAVTMGALAKPFAALALPAIWRRWDWRAPLVALATAALCYAPYLSVGSGVLGFVARGYLSEERLDTGEAFWPLAAFRAAFGAHAWDTYAYFTVSAIIIAALALRTALRERRVAATMLGDVSRLLVVLLFLVSPNYPWYFLVLTPFVALVGGAPLWAFTLGALLLQEEVGWDENIPILVRKTVLYAAFLAACAYAAWQGRQVRRAAEKGVER